jgi:DNA polymerase-3 subunit beta
MENDMQVNIKTLQALAKHIAPKTEIRYYLVGVQLEVTDAGRFYVATDGHKLVAIREARQEGDVNGDYLIPRDVILGVKIQKAGRKPVEFAEFELSDGKPSITYCGTETRFNLVDGKFPDWRRVVPTKVSGEIAQFNPDYLVEIRDCAAATIGIGKYSGLCLLHNGNSASLYQADSTDFIGVIMPLRINKADVYSTSATDLHINWGFSKPLESVAA